MLPSGLMAQSKTAYALWTEGNSTLTFLYTDNVYEVGKSRSGHQITNLWSGDAVLNTPTASAPGWASIKKKIKTIEFDKSFADARPSSIAYWFDNSDTRSESARTLTKIEGIEYLNTSDVTSMSYAFFRCAELLYVNLGNFNTAKVTDMSYMFMGCTAMLQLDLASFETKNVENMSNMFAQCSGLMSLDVSGFHTESVNDMSGMFNKCGTVPELNVSGFDTRNVTTFANMFNGCAGIREVDLSNFEVSKVSSAANMFASCSSLATIRAAEGANWSNIADISNMFSGCSKLMAVSVDGTSCKYEAGKNLPYVCSNGDGYFTSIDGYMITFVGYNSLEQNYQMVGKDEKILKLKKNEFTNANKVFGAWNTEKDGSGTTYYDEETIDIAGNMILYSLWGKDISLNDLTVNPLSFTYSGAECKPSVVISDIYKTLALNTDYKVEYANNIKAGEATIIIRGINEYAGTIKNTFTIKPVNIGVVSITPQRQVLAFSGNAQAPTYVLRHGDAKLVEGVDYEVGGIEGNSAVGDYTVTFTGKGNYAGTTTATYTISAQNAYAVWTEDNATLTFMMADDEPAVGELFDGNVITAFWAGKDVLQSPLDGVPAWNSTVKDKVKVVNFDPTFAEASPKSIAYWFDNSNSEGNSAQTLIQIKNIKNLNTSAVTSMKGAFYMCSALSLTDVSKFNTDLVTDMSYMFYGCSKTSKIDVSGFYTENVVDMSHMFESCAKVTRLVIDNFDTRNVTNMSSMFAGCSALTEVAVGGFNTGNVADMSKMFYSCSSLRTADVSRFDTKNVVDMSEMFYSCSSLNTLDVAKFDTQNVTSMASMFFNCSKLEMLDVFKFNTAKVTDMSGMFAMCTSLAGLNVSGFQTDNVADMSSMFANCGKLNTLDVSKFNTANVSNMKEMFYGVGAAVLKVDGFNTGKVSDMTGMFEECSAIKELYVGGFDMSNVKNITRMFRNCSSLAVIRAKEATDWSNVDSKDNVFEGCTSLAGIGADGTVCKFDEALDSPKTCVEGSGYYTPDNIYVITFDNNIDNQRTYQVVKKPVLINVKLQPNSFVNDSYNFVAWNTSADGQGSNYKNEAEIRVGSDICLYAQWGKDIELCQATVEPYYYTYTGKNIYATDFGGRIIVKDGDKTLVPNVDYTTKYPSDGINVGEYGVQIFGKGVYAGELVAKYEITPYDLADVTIEPNNAVFLYNGKAQCPEFILTDGNGNTLTEGVDYQLITDVSANIEGEEYMVEIEGIGNYEGSNYAFYAIKNAFVVWTETNNTLTFVLDENGYKAGVSYIDGHKVTKVWSGDAIAKSSVNGKPAWAEILGSLVTVNFKESFADVRPTSTAYWFAGAENLKNILYLENLNTSDVTSMSNMFAGCKTLAEVDVSNFKTENVTDMSDMFSGCAKLEELNVKNFNTSNVTNMNGMFAGCTSLRRILASSSADWSRTKPTTEKMFDGDKQLAGIGADGTYCIFVDGEIYPNTCKDGKGYFTDDDMNIITFDDNTASHRQTFQAVRKTNVAPVTLNANEFNNPGYVFINWNTEADGRGTAYNDNGDMQITENTTLYAFWKKDVAACKVEFDLSNTIYSGEAQEPAFSLSYDDYNLVEGEDYVIEAYNENINASNTKPYVTIRGRGNFAGTADKHFPIAPRDIKEVQAEVASGSNSLVYNKMAQAPTYVLTFGGAQLVEDTDYTIWPTDQNIDAGSYTVTIAGKGNFSGYNTKEYEIMPRDINVVTVATDKEEYEYNGAAVEPIATVRDGDDVLSAAKDYEISYSNNTNAGDANMSISGKGNYTGTVDNHTFKIVPLNLSKVTVTPENAQLPYNRAGQNPEFVLSVNGNNLKNTEYTISGDLLKTDIGDYSVKFAAVEPGNYTGETTANYSITKLDFSGQAKIVFANNKTNFTFTGSIITPEVSVVDEFGNTLVAGTDYTLDNSGNTEIGSYDIKATGIGNYTGEISANYRISEKSLEDATISWIGDNTFTYSGKPNTPALTVVDGITELVAGTDYNVEYRNNINASDVAEVVINGIGKYNQSQKIVNFTIKPLSIADATVEAGEAVIYNGLAQVSTFTITDVNGNKLQDTDYKFGDYSNNIAAAEYKVTIEGTGNYTGSVTGTYTIAGRSIENVSVTANETEKVYNGSEQTISLSVTDGERTLVLDEDYVVDCGGATNVGTATATVKGVGNYTGTATNTVDFTIVPLDFADVKFLFDGDGKAAYTGSGVMPKVNATDKFGNTLVAGTDYIVGDYSNNINIGTGYEVTFTGAGNYAGSITSAYDIKPRGIEDVEIVYVNGVKEFTYTGADIDPVEKVTDLGRELRRGIDYKIAFTNNHEPGTAIITVTGAGDYAGDGSKVETFVIKKIEMTDVVVKMSATEFPYNKKAQQPVFTLIDQNNNVLVADKDFTMSGNEGNTNAGEYTVTFAAVEGGHYNGETVAKYSITPQQVNVDDIHIVYNTTDFTYTGKAQEPEITVKYIDDELIRDTDYEIVFTDNINAGTVHVTINGKGNFDGFTLPATDYVINTCVLTDKMISSDNTTFTYGGTAFAPQYALADGNGNTLVLNTDYTVEGNSGNSNAGSYTVKFTGKGNYSGEVSTKYTIEPYDISGETVVVEFKDGINEFEYTGEEIAPVFELKINGYALTRNDNYTVSGATSKVNAGRYSIVAQGVGNFSGTKAVDYRIMPRNISGTANIDFFDGNKYIETGDEIKPAVFVSDGTASLADSDYEVTYQNNVAPGTAVAKVTGIGNYEGFEMTKEFMILPMKPEIVFSVDDDLVYGNSFVGKNIKAKTDDVYKGEITYNLSGLLVPGNYTIKASYTPLDATSMETSASLDVTVGKRTLIVNGAEVVASKDYDGTSTAIVSKQPSEIFNIYDADDVSATATAEFASSKPGSQDIRITYALSGKDADKYVARSTSVKGEIKKVLIVDIEQPKWDLHRQTAADFMGSNEQADAVHFCAGDNIYVSFNVKGMPNAYTVKFSDAQFGSPVQKEYPGNDQLIEIAIPNGVKAGKYSVTITIENLDAETVSEPYIAEFYLDGAADGENALVKTKWDDVVYASNADREFVAYQWYRDGKLLQGETNQYYQEKNGLVSSAAYSVKIQKADGNVVFSCPFNVAKSISKSAVSAIRVYPNPAIANEQFTVELENIENVDSNISILIYNHSGMLVKRIDNAASISHISLPSGQYSGMATVDGKQMPFRVIVQ